MKIMCIYKRNVMYLYRELVLQSSRIQQRNFREIFGIFLDPFSIWSRIWIEVPYSEKPNN